MRTKRELLKLNEPRMRENRSSIANHRGRVHQTAKMSRKSERTTTMKRAILFCFILAGCSAGTATSPSLTPLPTTGLPVNTKQEQQPFVNVVNYIKSVRSDQSVSTALSDEELVELATTWCDFMERGMNRTNLTSWIEEMASNQDEVEVWLVSAKSSATYICSEQEYKWNP